MTTALGRLLPAMAVLAVAAPAFRSPTIRSGRTIPGPSS